MDPINDGIMMLLDEVTFKGNVLGLISADGLDWGGDDPTETDLNAAQRRDGPVKSLITAPGTDVLTFQMIQLIAEEIAKIAGGTVVGEVYSGPQKVAKQEGAMTIKTGTGQTITIPKVSLWGNIRGGLGGTKNLYLASNAKILSQEGVAPYSIGPTAPAVSVSESELSFLATGQTQVVRISASGAVSLSAAPSGFTFAQDGNYLVITAANNTGAARTGIVTLTLVADPTKTATIALSQAGV